MKNYGLQALHILGVLMAFAVLVEMMIELNLVTREAQFRLSFIFFVTYFLSIILVKLNRLTKLLEEN